MAWFSKPKQATPASPALCARCGLRPGTTLMHFVSDASERRRHATPRTEWICDACRADVSRDAADN